MGKSVHFNIQEMNYKSATGEAIPVLRDVIFNVKEGDFVTIVGPSGCGKSTILRLIAGLEQADQGIIEVDGERIDKPGTDRSYVFQSYSSFPWLTVEENVLSGLQGLSKIEARKRAYEYINLVGLTKYSGIYPSKLSGGQQQRVAIARTLAMHSEVILMDEPYAALDAQTREFLQEELLKLWTEIRPTILFVTHDISEAAYLGQKILVLTEKPATILEEIINNRRSQELNNGMFHASNRLFPREEATYNELTIHLRRLLISQVSL
ncbi:MAG: ABC transporter ATP-binding protein [Methylobacter tundripaludum]|nr:ABC transporter ATP-binding protein [Methylobacter tundripaludum]